MFRKNTTILIVLICLIKLSWSRSIEQNATTKTFSMQHSESSDSEDNSDVKVINFPSGNQINLDIYRKAAIENSMDPDAVEEVLKSGYPFVKEQNDQNGMKTTTTYRLQPDGSISRHIKKEYKPIIVTSYTQNLPSHTEHTSLSSVSSPNRKPFQQEISWEWNPPTRIGEQPQIAPLWQAPITTYGQVPHVPQNPTKDVSIDRWSQTWGSKPEYIAGSVISTDTVRDAETINPDTVTKTFFDNNRKITTFHSGGPTEWHTTTSTFPLMNTWNYFNSQISTTRRPEISISDSNHNVGTTLPSLDDFLKSQYETTTKKFLDPKNTPTVPPNLLTQTPIKTININDLPIFKVVNTGTYPKNIAVEMPEPSIRTQTKTFTKTLQTNGIPQASDLDPNMKEILERAGIRPEDVLTSKDGTITKTKHEPDGRIITTTYRVRKIPTNTVVADSSDPIESLNKEKPYGPFPINGQTISTHKSHSGVEFPIPSNNPNHHNSFGTTPIFNSNWNQVLLNHPPIANTSLVPTKGINPIDAFLNQVNLTPAMIAASNGEIVKTILDDEGRVLTASFVLSTVLNNENISNDKAVQEPIK